MEDSQVTVADALENLLLVRKITLPDGTYIDYTYDKENHLKQVKRSDGQADGESVSYHYTYHDSGQLSRITDAQGNPYELTYQDKKVEEAFYPTVERYQESIRFTYASVNEGQSVTAFVVVPGASATKVNIKKYNATSGTVTVKK